MSFRYNLLTKFSRKVYRAIVPSVQSPYTIGPIDDICAVQLVPPDRMQAFFAGCVRRLRSLKGDVIGDYLEFGVFNGTSLSNMYVIAQQLDLKSMRFFGFDAFEGLPAESENEDDGVWKKGFYACSFEKMEECLQRKGIDPNGITWVKGWYKDTLTPALAQKHAITNLGIVFVDCDTYSSSKAVLDFIAPLIKQPCIICLDDWRLNDLDLKGMGEYRSFNEFLETNSHLQAMEVPAYKRNAPYFLVRPA